MLKNTLLSLLFVFSIHSSAKLVYAQQQAPPESAEVSEADTKKDPLLEQTIYIPYDKLSKVFESPSRGVFLPYEEFQKLWQAALATTAAENPVSIPLRSMITSISSEATVRGDVMEVSAQLSMQLIGLGWHEIPIRLSDAAISSAKIGDETARIIFRPGQGYFLLKQRVEGETEDLLLDLKYARTYTQSPGLNQVSFQAPQASINRWKIMIQDPGVKVNVRPLVAATEIQDGAARDDDPNTPPGPIAPATETVLIAFFGLTPQVHIDWTPRSEGAAGLTALATVQTRETVTIGEGSQRTQVTVNYSITRSELRELKIRIPLGQKISGVFDTNVRRWDVALAEGYQEITIELFEPVDAHQSISLELERFDLDVGMQNDSADVLIPEIEAVGVSRQQGLVMVKVEGDLRGDVATRTGLLQVDAAEVKAGPGWDFVYRYAALPYELILKIEKLQPRVTAQEYVSIQITPQQTRISVTTIMTVERAGIFQVDYQVPEGYRIRDVRGVAAGNVQAVMVENHHEVENAPGKYRVNFSRKAFGLVALRLSLEKQATDVNLMTPTGEASEYSFSLPRIVPASVEHVQGNLVVLVPEGLRVTPADTTGGQSVAVSEVQSTINGLVQIPNIGNSQPVHAFRYANESFEPVFSVERRQPQIEVGQLIVADIQAGNIQHNVTLYYNVRYSGIKKLRLDIPTSLLDDIRNDSKLVQELVMDPRPEDLADDYTAWELTSNRELLGDFQIDLSWIEPLDDLQVGSEDRVTLSRLIPQNVNRSWGQIVVKKSENLDVLPEKKDGLRAIDPRYDIQLGDGVANAAFAMEFHQPWNVDLVIHRYELQDVEQSAIELGVVDVQISKGGKSRVHAVYRIKSVAQRIEVVFPKNSKIGNDPLVINGETIGIEKNTSDGTNEHSFLIPLNTVTPGDVFVLELKYTAESDDLEIEVPWFKELSAINQIFLLVQLPTDVVLLGYDGDWDDHLEGSWIERLQRPLLGFSGDGLHDQIDVNSLLNNINSGVVDVRLGNHQGQRQALTFSAINPGQSKLYLSVATQSSVHFFVFGLLAGVTVGGLFLKVRGQLITLLVVIALSLGILLVKPIMASHLPLSGVVMTMCLMCGVWVIRDCARPVFAIAGRLTAGGTASRNPDVVEPDLGARDETDTTVPAEDEVNPLEDEPHAESDADEDSEIESEEEEAADPDEDTGDESAEEGDNE